jgi:hypothetical protein
MNPNCYSVYMCERVGVQTDGGDAVGGAWQRKKGFGYHFAQRYFSGALSDVSFPDGGEVSVGVPCYAAERGT